MTDDIMFVRKEIENGSNHEDEEEDKAKGLKEEMMKNYHDIMEKEDIEKGLREEMLRNDDILIEEGI